MKKFSVTEVFVVEQFMILVILLNDGYNNNVVCNKYLIIKIYYLIICNYYFIFIEFFVSKVKFFN